MAYHLAFWIFINQLFLKGLSKEKIHCGSEIYIPFDAVKQVLGDLVNVEDFISGEGEVDATPQSHLPQFLRGLVRIQAAVAQQETNYEKDSQQHT